MDDVVDCSMTGVTSHTGLTADARSATCRDLCTTMVAYVWCTDGSAQAKTHSYPQGAIIHSQTHRRYWKGLQHVTKKILDVGIGEI